MTNQEIKDICNYYGIFGYTVNPNGSIDVDGNVKLTYEYVENERINLSVYNIQKDLYHKWIISNRKNKIKAIENI